MKKVLIILLAVFMIIGITPVSAEEIPGINGYIEFDEEFTAEDALEVVYDGKLEYGDKSITKNSIMIGLEYAKEMGKKSANSSSTKASGEEEWTVISQTTLVSYRVLKGKYLRKVAAGVTIGSSGVSINVGGTLWGVDLSATITLSNNTIYNGPDGTELVTSGIYATHRYFSLLASGSIVQYTFRVTDRVSGAYLRTETRNFVANSSSSVYSNLASLDASTNYLIIRSARTNNYNSITETNWINRVNSQYAWSYVGF